MRRWRGLWMAACAAAACGCTPHDPQRIGATDPTNNIPAIQQAAREKDRQAIPGLVQQLDSDDPAVRFYAIEALRKLTGETFGYRFYDDTEQRRPAVARWKRYVAAMKEGRTAT